MQLFIKEAGKEISTMAKGSWIIKKELSIRVTLKMDYFKDKERLIGLPKTNMKVILKKEEEAVKESLSSKIRITMKDNFLITNFTDKADMCGILETFMKDNLAMDR